MKRVLRITSNNGSVTSTILIAAASIAHIFLSRMSVKDGVEMTNEDGSAVAPELTIFKLDGTELQFTLEAGVVMENTGDHTTIDCAEVTGVTIEDWLRRFMAEE